MPQVTKVHHRRHRVPIRSIRHRSDRVLALLVVHRCQVWHRKPRLSATTDRFNDRLRPELPMVEWSGHPGLHLSRLIHNQWWPITNPSSVWRLAACLSGWFFVLANFCVNSTSSLSESLNLTESFSESSLLCLRGNRQPRASPVNSPTLLGSSVPRPYVPGRIGLAEQKSLIAQQRATIRDQFFQTPLAAPPLISSMMSNNIKSKLSLPRTDELSGNSSYSITGKPSPAHSTVSSSTSKKYYETDLDLTIKVPKKSSESFHQETRKNLAPGEIGGTGTSSSSRVINISVVKSESLNYVSQQNEANNGHVTNKENADDIKMDRPNFTSKRSGWMMPSLSWLWIV